MYLYYCAIYAKDWRSSCFFPVEPSQHPLHSRPHKKESYLRQDMVCIFFLELILKQFSQALAEFDQDISCKTVTDDNIRYALRYIICLCVSFVVEIAVFYQLPRSRDNFVSLCEFFSHIQETHRWVFNISEELHVYRSHLRKLKKIDRLAPHRAPYIHKQCRPV